METLFCDLHMHSCLSPCGDDDMTPANLCGMAAVKGLDMIALTDHNAAGNLPAAKACCDAYGLLLIPGMEITTREEVHMLGYFPDVETAVAFGEMLREHLPKKKNKPGLFGNQKIMNEDDEQIGEEEALLIGATDLTLKDAAKAVRAFQGVPVPAHINRGSNGLLVNLGFMPEDIDFPTVEVWRDLPCTHSAQAGRLVLHSSDAHYLGDILEREITLDLEEKSVAAFLKKIREGKTSQESFSKVRSA
ncbi:MAG: PHP domain-containing protein [Clostridia bacterium]|nr:PHP domain-containing protein [Clostridia bacterium]